MILNDSIEIFNNIFVIQIFNEVDFLLNGLDLLFTDGHFLHGNKHAIVKVNSLVDQSISTFPDGFDDLIALNDFVFILCVHSKFNSVLLYLLPAIDNILNQIILGVYFL